MKKLFLTILSIVAALGLIVSSADASISPVSFNIEFDGVDYTGGTYIIPVGDDVSVSLYATSTVGLLSAGVDISFDMTQLGADNLTFGSGWLPLVNTISPGHIKFQGGLFTPVLPGVKALLVTFDLTCIELGLSDLEIYDLDSSEPNWLDADSTVIDNDISWPDPLATVHNVPLPGAFFLLASGLFGLIGIRHRSKN